MNGCAYSQATWINGLPESNTGDTFRLQAICEDIRIYNVNSQAYRYGLGSGLLMIGSASDRVTE